MDPGGDPELITQKLKAHNVTIKYHAIMNAQFNYHLIIKIHSHHPCTL